jgi:2-polyprenyl-3-methyl-5-hydroxy-6-metoxy-1,4-benzoquinol methylase
MPKKEFLDEYYKTAFLKIRPSQAEENNLRDTDYLHFELIQKNILSEFKNKKCKILNFGSGHGGVSLLLRSNNHIIYNFEYQTPKKNIFNTDYYFINDFDQIDKDTKFDIIYSSHVLEHLSDIFELLKQFKECSHENTFYFFEVPNGFNQKRVNPPHTYYFTKSFFEISVLENGEFLRKPQVTFSLSQLGSPIAVPSPPRA